MASPEHNTARPCAFCGVGELPDTDRITPQSHGICDLCVELATKHVDTFGVVAVSGLRRRVAMYPVESENIAMAGWRTGNGSDVGVLVLQFKAKPDMFAYSNVPHQWWELFWQAESKGAFFHRTIRADKQAHPFVKV
jgi:hypothetical protein